MVTIDSGSEPQISGLGLQRKLVRYSHLRSESKLWILIAGIQPLARLDRS